MGKMVRAVRQPCIEKRNEKTIETKVKRAFERELYLHCAQGGGRNSRTVFWRQAFAAVSPHLANSRSAFVRAPKKLASQETMGHSNVLASRQAAASPPTLLRRDSTSCKRNNRV